MPKVNSFDVFDTLIARRCIDPHEIFQAVEQKSGFINFRQQRLEAERRISDGEYTVDDIYAQFQSDTGIDPVTLDEIKKLELLEEIHNVIPIQENITKVKDGDVLLSDMYLPRDFIRRLVEAAGCKRETTLIVTSHGKSRGYIWPLLKSHIEIETHIGDNFQSDIQSARANGITASHTEASKPNDVEAFLRASGLLELCKLMRELRLSIHESSPLVKNWVHMQCKYNIPILILACLDILNKCTQLRVSRVLFSGRDCYYLRRIFDYISPKTLNINSQYFYTSRMARLSNSDDYSSYVRYCCSEKSLIVDLCGTGWSIGAMLESANLTVPFYLMHDLSDRDSITSNYQSIRQVKGQHERYFLIKHPTLDNSFIEKLNYVDHGMTLGVKQLGDLNEFVPIHSTTRYTDEINLYIKSTEFVVQRLESILASYDMNRMFAEVLLLGDNFPELFKILYSFASQNVICPVALTEYHVEEDANVMAYLKFQEASNQFNA